jgi:hypothetical protein
MERSSLSISLGLMIFGKYAVMPRHYGLLCTGSTESVVHTYGFRLQLARQKKQIYLPSALYIVVHVVFYNNLPRRGKYY